MEQLPLCDLHVLLRHYHSAKVCFDGSNFVFYFVRDKDPSGIRASCHTFQSSLKKLISKQNKIVRVIYGANLRSKVGPLYSKLNLLTLKNITTYQQCILMYQCVNKLMPDHFVQLFNNNQNVHNLIQYTLLLINTFAKTKNLVIPT